MIEKMEMLETKIFKVADEVGERVETIGEQIKVLRKKESEIHGKMLKMKITDKEGK